MSVSITLFLFWKPENDFDEERCDDAPSPADLRAVGDTLRERLHFAAEASEKLKAAGWDVQIVGPMLEFSHPDVETVRQARKALKAAGFDASRFDIHKRDDADVIPFGASEN